jgi:hypothetical protein
MNQHSDDAGCHFTVTRKDVSELYGRPLYNIEWKLFREYWENTDNPRVLCGARIMAESGLKSAIRAFFNRVEAGHYDDELAQDRARRERRTA